MNVIQKNELQSDTAVVTDYKSVSESLKNVKISVDHETYARGVERVHTNGQPPGEWSAQQRGISARRDRPPLSQTQSSVSSCSRGEFVPPVQLPAPPVYEPSTSEHDHDSTLSRAELQSMSREQVLRLLSQQQDEISCQETELSNVNSGIQLTKTLFTF